MPDPYLLWRTWKSAWCPLHSGPRRTVSPLEKGQPLLPRWRRWREELLPADVAPDSSRLASGMRMILPKPAPVEPLRQQ